MHSDAWVALAGLVGLWLLVIGPTYQAVLELTMRRRALDAILTQVYRIPIEPVRGSWWLLPPVAAVLWWRRLREHLAELEDVLGAEQADRWRGYLDACVGWGIVALGAVIVASAQTASMWTMVPTWVLLTMWFVGVLGTGGMAVRMIRGRT